MKQAVEHVFTGDTVPYTAYDSTKTTLGALIRQMSGATGLDKFAGPIQIGMARPMEQSTAIASSLPHVISFSSTVNWVFLADNANASATRRVICYTHNLTTNVWAWQGFITLTPTPTSNRQIRGFRITRDLYSTGTVQVAATAVTGSGTLWKTARFAVGARIGFGSTDPTAITTWYPISAMATDTGITLGTSAGTIGAGTAYVIEELRVVWTETNATATNGGLYVCKGVNFDDFKAAGTNFIQAVSTDNLKAIYWLKDASTVTNTVALGACLEDKVDDTTHYLYVPNGASSCNIFKYNLRAALTVATGISTNAWVLTTGAQALVGTAGQINNGRLGTLSHGPGAGVESLYLATTIRIVRANKANITSGNTSWISDMMVEIPPGSASTYAATSVMSCVELMGSIDRLVIMTTGASGARAYVTKYNVVSDQFDHIFLVDTKQLDQSLADSGGVTHPTINASAMSVWSENGMMYLARGGTTAALNQVYSFPASAHWAYAGGTVQQRLVTPALATPSATKLYRVYVNSATQLGDGTFGMPTEPYRLYYRTGGIPDDSGAWLLLDDTHDLTGVSPAASIQFAFEFKLLGTTCIPARIYSLSVVYDADDSLPSELRWNVGDCDQSNGTVGATQTASFGGVPVLTITYRRTDTDAAVLVQGSGITTNGAWEYWNGSAWTAGVGPDTIGTRRRFVPSAGLPTGVNTYAKIVAS